MCKYPFHYKVYCQNLDEKYFYYQQGIGLCESFTDAADQIEKTYGNELIAIKQLELFEEETLIALPEGVCTSVINVLKSNMCCEDECEEED